MKSWLKKLCCRTALAAGILSGASFAALAEEVRIGMAADVTSMDPHFAYFTPNNMISYHVFDTLAWIDGNGKLTNRLADSWSNISENEWELKLRGDVKWHDGSSFSADDVVFSLERVDTMEGGAGGLATMIATVSKVEKVDPLTVRITTSTPTPNLMLALSSIAIVPAANQGKTTADYNSGAAMIGTGPFKFVSYTPGAEIKLKANEGWWGGKVPWTDVSFQIVTNPAVRSTSLLSGNLDVIEMPAAADVERIAEDERFHLMATQALRVAIVNLIQEVADDGQKIMDAAGGKTIQPSPLTDRRVREALSLAINRDGLVNRILLGAGSATGQLMPSGSFGYMPDFPVPAYDLERAKALLAEAGYPDGFSLPFIAASDRVPMNVDAGQAIAQMWSRIGVKASFTGVPTSVYIREASNQKIPAYLGNWGNSSGEAGTTLMTSLETFSKERSTGLNNWSRYSNPKFDELVDKAMTTMDAAEREKLLQEATRIALDDYAVLPVYHFKNQWALRKDLEIEPRRDAMTIAWRITPSGE